MKTSRSFLSAGIAALLLTTATFAHGSEVAPGLRVLFQVLAKTDDTAVQLNLLRGINEGLKGSRGLTAPEGWEPIAGKLAKSPSAEVREQVQTLSAVFGSSSAFAQMRKIAADPSADAAAREKALESLVSGKDAETLPLLLELLKAPGPMKRAALRGLAAFEDERIPAAIIAAFASLDAEQKRDAIAALLARSAWARALVSAFDSKKLAASELAPAQVRQLAAFKDPQIDAWLKRHPLLLATSPDKQAEVARYKAFLTPESIKTGNAAHGRAIFAQTCAVCHVLFDAGGQIGPELTGANRTDIDYLLQNIVDPNALIGQDYQTTTIETKDGRFIVGMVRAEDANAFTIKTLADQVIVPRGDVKTLVVGELSMMPEGLLTALKPKDARDLFAYLASPQQVALPAP